MDLRNLIWIFFLLVSLQPVVQGGLPMSGGTLITHGRRDRRRPHSAIGPSTRSSASIRPGERAPSRHGQGTPPADYGATPLGGEPMGKQMEGDNRQRRRLARLARKLGKRPSELQATTGASKQREHEERDEDHETKLMRRRQGKQASALWRIGRH
jgi:hypothetical protein